MSAAFALHAFGVSSLPRQEKMVDIISGTAPIPAVKGVFFLIKLRQGGFGESGGGAKEGNHPHPENRARAAGGNGGNHAHQISHSHTGGG